MEFYLDPGGINQPDLSVQPALITLVRANGETVEMDPQQAQLHVIEEHPQLNQMGEDWGAVCEVFRKKTDYYLSLRGISLAVGDVVSIHYQHIPTPVVLKVTELENGRARIEPPVFGSRTM